jgi:hypothetical protein
MSVGRAQVDVSYRELEGTWEDVLLRTDELLGHRVRVTILDSRGTDGAATGPGSIQDRILAIAADIPDEELARLPPDLTDNLDHYIYGSPKRQ